jgi:hypothetical protein
MDMIKLSTEIMTAADKKKEEKQKAPVYGPSRKLIEKIRTEKEDEIATPWEQTQEGYKNELMKGRSVKDKKAQKEINTVKELINELNKMPADVSVRINVRGRGNARSVSAVENLGDVIYINTF